MFRWTPFPLIRITIIFCGGVLFGIYFPAIPLFKGTPIFILLIFSIAVLAYWFRKKALVFKYCFWLSCFVLLAFSGFSLVKIRTAISKENHFLNLNDSIFAYEATIQDHIEEKKNSYKTTVSINKVKTHIGWINCNGKVNFYISKSGFSNDLIWGDHILVTGSPVETSAPSNPHEFNYKRFLTFKNIYLQHYVRENQWIRTGRSDQSFLRYSSFARNYFSDIIKKNVHRYNEQGVALALIIGVKDGIDSDLISAYSASGAMHVLAVSGLHVGIIYWILLLLLKPFQKGERGKWIVSALCLCILWSYAFVTGLSPSVLRAVMMFSFVAVARAVNHKSSVYNTLAGSAFILLIIDPFLIMSVGFQLSYLAVIGIIWIQRPLYNLYEPTNGFIDWVWKISCVSIAAQATTFSLGLLYFHQFPTYFLFSNLIVIPAATAVLILGIALLALSFINPLASLVGWLLEKVSLFLNWSVFTVEDLPYSIVSNIYLDVPQSWLILGILTSIIFIFQYKRIHWLYVAVGLSVIVLFTRWNHYSELKASNQFVVYDISGETAVEFMENGRSVFFADSSLLSDADKIRFHISGNRLFNLISRTENSIIKGNADSLQLISIRAQRILFVESPIKSYPVELKADYIIVNKKSIRSITRILDHFPTATVIIDGTCNLYSVSKIKPKIKEPERVYSVAERGAFIKSL